MSRVEDRLAALESWCAELRRSARISGSARVKVYPVISAAVEAGVRHGWARGWKHRDDMPEGAEGIIAAIEEAVMSELCEVLEWDEG